MLKISHLQEKLRSNHTSAKVPDIGKGKRRIRQRMFVRDSPASNRFFSVAIYSKFYTSINTISPGNAGRPVFFRPKRPLAIRTADCPEARTSKGLSNTHCPLPL